MSEKPGNARWERSGRVTRWTLRSQSARIPPVNMRMYAVRGKSVDTVLVSGTTVTAVSRFEHKVFHLWFAIPCDPSHTTSQPSAPPENYQEAPLSSFFELQCAPGVYLTYVHFVDILYDFCSQGKF